MDPTLIPVAILGSLYLIIAVAEKTQLLWSKVRGGGTPDGQEFQELKAYTHVNVHELRGLANEAKLGRAADEVERAKEIAEVMKKVSDNSERIGRVEATMAAQTTTMERLIDIVQNQLVSRQQQEGGP